MMQTGSFSRHAGAQSSSLGCTSSSEVSPWPECPLSCANIFDRSSLASNLHAAGPMKTALICGISGQDGAYLSKLLLERGYRVVGTSRDHQLNSFDNLKRLRLREDVECCSVDLTDFHSTLQTLATVKPDEVYNLAGPSSVALSFEQPIQAIESICLGALHLLESIRFLDRSIRFYNASSSE